MAPIGWEAFGKLGGMLQEAWDILPLVSAAMVGGVITLMTAWPRRVQDWEEAHPRTMRFVGLSMAAIVIMGAISGYQQQNKTATRADLGKLEEKTTEMIYGGDSFAYIEPRIRAGELDLVIKVIGTYPLNVTFGQLSVPDGRVIMSYPDGQPGIIRPGQGLLMRGRAIPIEELVKFARTDKPELIIGFRAVNGESSGKVSLWKSERGWRCTWSGGPSRDEKRLSGTCI